MTKSMILSACLLIAQSAAAEEALFNGEDLTGWANVMGNGSKWEVKNGCLQGKGAGKGSPAVLACKGPYSNFRLTVVYGQAEPGWCAVEVRRAAEGNRTSSYFVAAGTDKGRLGRPPGNVTRLAGFAYGKGGMPPARPSAEIPVKPKAWHTLVITCVGNRVTTEVDGQEADDVTDNNDPHEPGGIALFCDGETTARFKSVVIEELPD